MSILGLLADQDDTQGINLNTKMHVKIPEIKPEQGKFRLPSKLLESYKCSEHVHTCSPSLLDALGYRRSRQH